MAIDIKYGNISEVDEHVPDMAHTDKERWRTLLEHSGLELTCLNQWDERYDAIKGAIAATHGDKPYRMVTILQNGSWELIYLGETIDAKSVISNLLLSEPDISDKVKVYTSRATGSEQRRYGLSKNRTH